MEALKLAAAGMLPEDPLNCGDAAVRLSALGLTGASWRPASVDALAAGALGQLREHLSKAGLRVAQLLPPDMPSFVDPDPAARQAAAEVLARCGEAARVLEADNLYVRPGSLNPNGAWTPHRDNRRRETLDRLAESLVPVAVRAQDQGITLALEGHVVSPVYTPEAALEVLDRVGSPALRFNFDPVNFIGSIDDAYNPAPLMERLAELLGRCFQVAHIKDVEVEERLVMHLSETVPGRGNLDQGQLVRLFQRECPEGWLIIEHLRPEDLPEAVAAVRRSVGGHA